MGIPLNQAYLLFELARLHGLNGRVCTLGVQNLPFTFEQLESAIGMPLGRRGRVTAAALFSGLGFSSVEALDFSDYEGAEHIFDLNDPELPDGLCGKYDVLLNGGTLEHVFHVPNALTNISRMLRPGGAVIHLAPCNNWAEHGFYQFSPTLMFDYYDAAGYSVMASLLCRYAKSTPAKWRVEPAVPGSLAGGAAGSLNDDICSLFFAARRGERINTSACPIQRIYAGAAVDLSEIQRLWFKPFVIENGVREMLPAAEINLAAHVRPDTGACWCAELPEVSDVSDGMHEPSRSPLMVLENGLPLGPQHSAIDTIRTAGRGRLSHWGAALYFSTSDNTDPRTNGRSYTAYIPRAV